jgi:hypothetical protein
MTREQFDPIWEKIVGAWKDKWERVTCRKNKTNTSSVLNDKQIIGAVMVE